MDTRGIDRYLDHFIWSTYLNTKEIPTNPQIRSVPELREFTLQSVIDAASLLESNCSPCPDGENLYNDQAFLRPFPLAPRWYDINNGLLTFDPHFNKCSAPNLSRSQYFSSKEDFFDYSKGEPFTANVPAPGIEYVGCTYDGKTSKSLYRYNLNASPVLANKNLQISTFLFCAEGASNLKFNPLTDKEIAHVDYGVGLPDPEYFSIYGFPFCYNYKVYLNYYYETLSLEDISVPFEDCSSCPINTVQIDGECTCPDGMTLTVNGCEKSIICKTEEDYQAGQCQCQGGSKPYRKRDLMGNFTYTCEVPPFKSPSNSGSYNRSSGGISGDVSVSSCSIVNGVPQYTVNLNLQSQSRPATIYAECVGKTYRLNELADFESVKLNANSSMSHQLHYQPLGDCYEYKFYAIEDINIYWEKSITIPYPHCK